MKGLPSTPVIPVAMDESNGRLCLLDRHHTFSACMALGQPVKLALMQGMMPDKRKSWKECNWKGFDKPGEPLPPITEETSTAAHEGKVVKVENWQEVVPWRVDKPESEERLQDFAVKCLGSVVSADELKKACACDKHVAEMLYEIMRIDGVNVELRPPPKDTSGGDWNPDENTIYLDNNLGPVELVDMLVFEAENALRAGEFSKLQHEAYAEKTDPAEVGEGRAKIEARTTIAYIEHLLARQAQNLPIAPQGQKALDKVDLQIKGYTKMSPSDRKNQEEKLTDIIINSAHGGAGAKLPDRKALSTSAMYFYERVAATQNINGIKVFFNKKIAKEKPNHARALEFENAMKLVKDSPKDQLAELSWAGKFYDICSQAANQIFGLGVTEFSGDQRQVADHEYQELQATWAGALTQKFDDFKEVMSYKILSAASADQIIGLLRGPS